MSDLLPFSPSYLENISGPLSPSGLPPGWTGPFDFERYYYDQEWDFIAEHDWCRDIRKAVESWNADRHHDDEQRGRGRNATPVQQNAQLPLIPTPSSSDGNGDGEAIVRAQPDRQTRSRARSRSRSTSRDSTARRTRSVRSRSPHRTPRRAGQHTTPGPSKRWTPAEITLFCSIYLEVAQSRLFPGEKRFDETSRRMRELGYMRSTAAVKNQWNRVGRARTEFDERRKKTDVLATSLQGKRTVKRRAVRQAQESGALDETHVK